MSALTIREKIKFLDEAFKEASLNLNSANGGPFGAVIVDLRKKEIIGRGHNTVIFDKDPTCHAEINAIRNACKNINNHILFNTAIFTTCYPCPMCMSAIFWARISDIYYSGSSSDAARIGFDDEIIYDYISRVANPLKFHKDLLNKNLDSVDKIYREYYDEEDLNLNVKREIIHLIPDMNNELFDQWINKKDVVIY